MRGKIIYISLIAIFLAVANQVTGAEDFTDVPVEVTEIKDLGVSSNDDSKSIIEVSWRVNPTLNAVTAFNLRLIISYADGTTYADGKTIDQVKKTDGKTLSTRFEVPSVKVSKGKQPAFIKKMNAVVTAVIREKSL